MAYSVATMITAVRSLLDESAQAFFLDTEITDWIAQATLDISTVSKSVEAGISFGMLLGQWFYALPADSIEVFHVVWDATKQALRKITPSMVGEDSPEVDGDRPLTWFEWGQRVYVNPVPDAAAAGQNVTVFYARSTTDVTLLNDRYQLLAIKYATYMGKLKDKRYAEAAALYAEYGNSLIVRSLGIQQRLPQTEAELHLPARTVTGGG